MRKAAVMVGFGAFFIAMAMLMRFYAYPKLATIPTDTNTQQVVSDDHATYFDATSLKERTGHIDTTVTVVGDKGQSKQASSDLGKSAIVINEWRTTIDPKAPLANGKTAPPIDGYTEHAAVDRSTGAALAWSQNSMNGKATTITGQVLKFPFDTSKSGHYSYFDTTLEKAFPVTYAGEETIRGMKTYKFTQSIPKTVFEKQQVPGEVLGMPKGGVNADRSYANDRTLWIDPVTGVIIKLEEKEREYLDAPGGKTVNAMDTDSIMTDATIKSNVDQYKSKASQLKMLKTALPWTLGVLGVLALLAGLVLSALSGGRRGRHQGTGEERVSPEGHDYDNDDTLIFSHEAAQGHGASPVTSSEIPHGEGGATPAGH